MIKTRVWICLLVGLLLVGLALLLWPQEPARTAEIWSDGVLVQRVSLAQDQSFSVESPYGTQHHHRAGGLHCRDPIRLSWGRLHADRLAGRRQTHRLSASPAGHSIHRRGGTRRHIRLKWRKTAAILPFSLTFYGASGRINPILPVLVEDRPIF